VKAPGVAAGPVVIENCAIAAMDGPQHDGSGAEYPSGHIVVTGGRITAVGGGPAPGYPAPRTPRIDRTRSQATPGQIKNHPHQ
jgi:imidazolonepropionase-like amidohydrolase